MITQTAIYDKIINKIKNRLVENNFSYTPGSICRLFTEIITEEFANFYISLDENILNCFISTSKGSYLDNIGLLVNCTRLEDEDDNSYKFRITNQINILASSNELSIKMATLSVDGISDVFIKKYSMGAGSFSIILLDDNLSETKINEVYTKVSEVVACGVKFEIIPVEKILIKMTLSISFVNNIDSLKKRDIKTLVKQKIKDYISDLKIGEIFVVNKLTEVIMSCSEYILSFNCENMFINNEEVNFINHEANWYSKFYVDSVLDAINIL